MLGHDETLQRIAAMAVPESARVCVQLPVHVSALMVAINKAADAAGYEKCFTEESEQRGSAFLGGCCDYEDPPEEGDSEPMRGENLEFFVQWKGVYVMRDVLLNKYEDLIEVIRALSSKCLLVEYEHEEEEEEEEED